MGALVLLIRTEKLRIGCMLWRGERPIDFVGNDRVSCPDVGQMLWTVTMAQGHAGEGDGPSGGHEDTR